MIKRFHNFVNENYVNPVRSDLKKFDGALRHKMVVSNTDDTFNLWIADDKETSLKVTRLYTGRHALDLGGYAPSYNDVWLEKNGIVVVVKTNKDDIVPDEVLRQAATILLKKSEREPKDYETVRMSLSFYLKVSNGEFIVDDANSGRVVFTPGNIKIER